jgi:rsbT antagonist protein RsbS
MLVPILKIEDFLVVSIQVPLHDKEAVEFQNNLLTKLNQSVAKGVVVDITAVEVVDSFMARTLNDIAIGVHLLGAEMVIVGIQPAVAITLVEMGLTLAPCNTALDLDKGIKLLRQMVETQK